jgi:ketosteroid isomerase-like protein
MTDEPAGQHVPEDIHRIAARLYEAFAAHDGRPLSAAFAHVLRFAGGRVPEIVQITDTARWHDALGPADDR